MLFYNAVQKLMNSSIATYMDREQYIIILEMHTSSLRSICIPAQLLISSTINNIDWSDYTKIVSVFQYTLYSYQCNNYLQFNHIKILTSVETVRQNISFEIIRYF